MAIGISLLLAGSFLFSLAGGRVPPDVTVQGVEVGGLRYSVAETLVREQIKSELLPLTIRTPKKDYVFRSEFSFTDDVPALLRGAKSGDKLQAHVKRVWADAESALEKICEENAEEGENATVSFSVEGFTYTAERPATCCNYSALLRDVCSALESGGTEVPLSTFTRAPAITLKTLRGRTKLLSTFTTRFDGNNAVRAGNIALACSRITGTTLDAGEEFSFNKTVGKRTKENGFGEAIVIFDGEFVPGVGGGVCQASTTLFNAALRAGLTITESRSHSLSISYVSPSLDAMVSEYSDLRFINPYEFPVYIGARTGKNTVTFDVFGAPDGYRYETESVVLKRVSPPEPKRIEGAENACIRAEKEGLTSESYLLVYDSEGNLISRKKLRRDSYAALQGIYQVAPEPPPEEENPEEQPPETNEEGN
ncbi:MAG: VanW family protein [Clostridiales bacterium]|nr:VanW family protein [Clostridiales bacterium]